jgi:hypothetical protein
VQVSAKQLRGTVLPRVAFLQNRGPFRMQWTRFGYDPRLDPESRMYQTFELRSRKSKDDKRLASEAADSGGDGAPSMFQLIDVYEHIGMAVGAVYADAADDGDAGSFGGAVGAGAGAAYGAASSGAAGAGAGAGGASGGGAAGGTAAAGGDGEGAGGNAAEARPKLTPDVRELLRKVRRAHRVLLPRVSALPKFADTEAVEGTGWIEAKEWKNIRDKVSQWRDQQFKRRVETAIV